MKKTSSRYQLPPRTLSEWKEMAEKYFDAMTSEQEETELRLFLSTHPENDEAFDELRVVMGLFSAGKKGMTIKGDVHETDAPWPGWPPWRSSALPPE